MISTTYQVTGMTCEHCARAVTAELIALPEVTLVSVGLVPEGESGVTVTSEAPLAEAEVAAALDEAGGYRLAGDAASSAWSAPSAARTLPLA